MSWYYLIRYIALMVIVVDLYAVDIKNEDNLVVQAFDLRNNQEYNASATVFAHLFSQTQKIEYAKEALVDAMRINNKEIVANLVKSQDVLNFFNDIQKGGIFEFLGEEQKSFSYYELACQKDNQGCLQLLKNEHYLKNNLQVLNTLFTMYINYKNNQEEKLAAESIESIRDIIQHIDSSQAISFLEAHDGFDDELLIDLYQRENRFGDMAHFLKKLFVKTGNSNFLAQSAMIEYQIAENKEKILDATLGIFKEVLELGNTNNEFLYFYANLLIVYERDLQKGIRLIEQALQSDSENFAYLDLAGWGYYKQNNCAMTKKMIAKINKQYSIIAPDDRVRYTKTCKE